MNEQFIEPRYDAGGFTNIPAHIVDLFNSNKYDAVVLILVDGFGWRFFEKYQEAPFLQNILREGTATKLLSQFPSTTAAHLTTLHTGMPVGEHGVYEWFYYEPALDAIIAPLLFSHSGTAERDTLKSLGIKPRSLYPHASYYLLLKKMGVSSVIFQHREYTPSTYGNIVFSGALARGYKTIAEALVSLPQMLAVSKSPAYFVLYFDKVDAISHEYGPSAPQTEAEILMFLSTMEQVLLKSMQANQKKLLFLLTADHGHVEVDPQTTIYLNRDRRFEGMERFLRTDRQGNLLIPAGSARDFFLYIRKGMLDEALSFLASRLAGKAEVRKIGELAEAGYFGPLVSPEFLGRAGDLVILPYAGESVWWFEKEKFEQRFRGHHGGLTRQEMEIPLIMWEMM